MHKYNLRAPALVLLLCLVQPIVVSAIDARPQYHFLAPSNWMNDPCGPFFDETSQLYHLFYQYNPTAAVWGDMHWGHATSPDLVHWTYQPIAISPTPGGPDEGGIWTGSITMIGSNITVMYTGVSDYPYTYEEQCLAWPANATDPYLTNFTKWSGNPVIEAPPHPITAFRDPTTAWQLPGDNSTYRDTWYYLVGAGIPNGTGQALLYTAIEGRLETSTYLTNISDGMANVTVARDGAIWECPDFYQQPAAVADESLWIPGVVNGARSGESRGKSSGDGVHKRSGFKRESTAARDGTAGFAHHVLKVSARALGYGDLYYTGIYDVTTQSFSYTARGVYDYGQLYASKSFYDTGVSPPRRIVLGWTSEGDSPASYEARGWAGAHILPRVANTLSDGTLTLNPIPELESLRKGDPVVAPSVVLNAGSVIPVQNVKGDQLEIIAWFQVESVNASIFGLEVLASSNRSEFTRVTLSTAPTTNYGYDRTGYDYEVFANTEGVPSACEDACNNDVVCQAWSYVDGGESSSSSSSGNGHCHLKSPIPPLTANGTASSGTKPYVSVDRYNSSLAPDQQTNPNNGGLGPLGSLVDVHIFVDHSIVEVFANGGRARIVSRVYPTLNESLYVNAFCETGTAKLVNVTSWQMSSLVFD